MGAEGAVARLGGTEGSIATVYMVRVHGGHNGCNGDCSVCGGCMQRSRCVGHSECV